MDFRITGLAPHPFAGLFALTDAELAARRAIRKRSDAKPGFPCRVSLDDVDAGNDVILLHYEHLPVESPYRASHAIYVGANSRVPYDRVNEIPPALERRLLSVRAFAAGGIMVDADITEGRDLAPLIRRFLADDAVEFIHAHFAKRGCFAARIDRAK